jgi:hypothetical protein
MEERDPWSDYNGPWPEPGGFIAIVGLVLFVAWLIALALGWA